MHKAGLSDVEKIYGVGRSQGSVKRLVGFLRCGFMKILWDEDKRHLVLKNREIDFAQLDQLLHLPYIEDHRNDNPEQYRIIGFAGGRLVTFIVEYRHDEEEEYFWVVTAWHATKQEQRAYEQETR